MPPHTADFYATVSATGLVTAHKVGATNIVVSSGGQSVSVPVTVSPVYNLYPDLDVYVGKKKADVLKDFGSGYTESGNSWAYLDYNKYAAGLLFRFESGDIISATSALVYTQYSNNLADYLNERYLYLGVYDEIPMLINHDEDVLIGVSAYNTNALMVVYASAKSDSKSVSAQLKSFGSALPEVL